MNRTIAYYEQHAEAFCKSTRSADIRALYAPFLAHLAPGSAILDCGCGSGRDSLFFLQRGYAVTALDASAALCRLASAYTGLPVRCASFEDISSVSRYDGIWACASLLHAERSALPGIFSHLAGALKPGGVLYASFKYGTGSGERGGRFYTDLDEDRLAALLACVDGLLMERCWITGDVRPDHPGERWLNVLLLKAE